MAVFVALPLLTSTSCPLRYRPLSAQMLTVPAPFEVHVVSVESKLKTAE